MCSLCLEVGLWSVSVDQGLLERHGLGGLGGGHNRSMCVCVCDNVCEREMVHV